ncbi:DUF4386 domain-containing protein [Herbiconiux moechotypicola]|uniref:DUF4386 domain-containing protein n=1 Tax=Herbiconiux moechotypicola TaxID=637393 RepID=A0ABN3DXT7_9MICO|nr:DUF4386 domain-containing protein [Herbiconiux moechotypicola]MCS5730854.1 DUF4386 domain-containing protein [Herbiconiux moechotypicola]
MPSPRLARLAGVLYLLTFVTSIPALALKTPLLTDPASAAAAGPARWAGLLEIVLALACVGTAVALYPLTSRVAPAAALGFVASRVLEGALVLVGVMALLALAAAATASGAADADTGTAAAAAADPLAGALVALHDQAFLLGPGLLPAVNAVLLGGVLWRGRLVPRIIPLVGLIGAPVLAASAVASLFGVLPQVSPLAGLAALPIALWELAIGLWLTFRGLRLSAASPTGTTGTSAPRRG